MKWSIYATVIGSQYVGKVEAATKEEAIAKAWDELQPCVSLCHECADQCEDPEIDSLKAERA